MQVQPEGGMAQQSTISTLKANAPSFVPSTPICNYFMRGYCRNGDLCGFRHPTLSQFMDASSLSGQSQTDVVADKVNDDERRASAAS